MNSKTRVAVCLLFVAALLAYSATATVSTTVEGELFLSHCRDAAVTCAGYYFACRYLYNGALNHSHRFLEDLGVLRNL